MTKRKTATTTKAKRSPRDRAYRLAEQDLIARLRDIAISVAGTKAKSARLWAAYEHGPAHPLERDFAHAAWSIIEARDVLQRAQMR